MEIARISALTELASGVAHELNQPLGAIATFAQAGERMLNRPEPLVSETLEVLRQINDAALGAGEGIRRIRRLFDQDASVRVTCQISELIDELKPVLELFAQRVGAQLHVDLDLGLPAVSADRLRIQHVIIALVQNACDAGALGASPPKISVSANSVRYMVEIGISDSGPGVPVTAQRQLFRPFFTTKQHGTGLGLASSKAIIEAHEGTMGFDNLSSGGSRFWFRLPVANQRD
ncbi:MAG TPA: ATP-binding protein [Steroidobacteraceae bacterium]|jgi:two-component system sensor kinase FixL